jgi:site-specific recombinase XerD
MDCRIRGFRFLIATLFQTKNYSAGVIMQGSRPLTRGQVKAVLKVTDSIREKALLTLGFATGYRISELLSLTVADIATNGIIHSHVTVKASNTKNKQGRTVLLNSDAKKALSTLVSWLKAKGLDHNAPLFVSRKHVNGYVAISRQQAHKLLKALFAAIGEFGNVSTHTMRKTFALAIYSATNKIELVQIALGHKSITSTVAYLSFNNVEIDNVIMGMEF